MLSTVLHTTPKKRAKNSVFYRFGMNSQEKVNEVYGEGNAYGFEARMYDPRLGRWMSVDPKFKDQPSWSPYKSFKDNPIIYNDPGGETEFLTYIVTDRNTGQQMIIHIVVSDEVFYDGVLRMEDSFGHSESDYHVYRDHQTIYSIDFQDGKVVDAKVVSPEAPVGPVQVRLWFRDDAVANTKITGKGGFQVGGIYMTSKDGGTDPTKFKALTYAEQMKNADVLISALGGFKGDGPEPNVKTVLGKIKFLVEKFKTIKDAGDKLIETGESTYDMITGEEEPDTIYYTVFPYHDTTWVKRKENEKEIEGYRGKGFGNDGAPADPVKKQK